MVTDHIMQSHSWSRNVCKLQFRTQYNQMLSTNACRSCSTSQATPLSYQIRSICAVDPIVVRRFEINFNLSTAHFPKL